MVAMMMAMSEPPRRRLSSITHSAPVPTASPLVSDDVVLLLQEWLTLMHFSGTLRCLQDEYTKLLQRAPPATEHWVRLTHQLEPLWQHTHAIASAVHAKPLLDRLVSYALAQSKELVETIPSTLPSTVVVSKRPQTASHLKFASKRALPLGGGTHSKSTTALPPPKLLRPKSAIVATSKSTPELKHHPVVETKSPSPNQRSSPVQEDVAARRMSRQSPSSPTGSRMSMKATASTARLLQEWTKAKEVEKKMAQPVEGVQPDTDVNGTDPATATPAIELEDMSEELLTEQYSGFSKGTIKRLRRVLAKSSAHSQELQRTRKAMDKIQLKAQQQHERSAMATHQTELLSSTMDMLIKEPCSLCRHVFLKKNLTTKVSYKSVCDLRTSWAAKQRKEKRAIRRDGLAADTPEVEENEDEDEGEPVLAIDQALESTQQISHLYDEVPVCVFCAQLVLDFSSYRPSSAEQKQKKEEKRRAMVERMKEREAQRQRDKFKCDPLDFQSYELNSDDEDTEECIEVDDAGRFHIRRRLRPRRRTERVPAQLGLVSKRLHYDHLRSGSVHQLNKKEWGILSDE